MATPHRASRLPPSATLPCSLPSLSESRCLPHGRPTLCPAAAAESPPHHPVVVPHGEPTPCPVTPVPQPALALPHAKLTPCPAAAPAPHTPPSSPMLWGSASPPRPRHGAGGIPALSAPPEPVAEPESFAAWADRIAEEHHRRHCYRPPPPERAPPRTYPPTRDESQLFQQRQREKEAQVGRARARRSAGGPKSTGGRLKPPQAAREPPKNTGDPPETDALLRFEDVPWPCPGGDAEAMASAALRGVPPPPDGPPGPYRRLLRQQRARWHPDRFARLWGGRLRPPDRARALAVATALAQALNRRADAAKGQ